MEELSYKASGVDLEAAQSFKEQLAAIVNPTHGENILSGVGGFGAAYKLANYKSPILISSTDGVGTKLRLAILLENYDTIGEDLVNACVNDILVSGADPLFFLDYIAVGTLQEEVLLALIKGIARACEYNSCALIGGETAQMPGMYSGSDFDMAGFVLGAVEEKDLIDGKNIVPDDILIGIPSNGLHTNGYSLARKIFDTDNGSHMLCEYDSILGSTYGEALMLPHTPYFKTVSAVRHLVKGMAHVTGGGLIENIPRVLPSGVAAVIDHTSWEIPQIFRVLQLKGNIPQDEMFRVFNMGIGMVIVSSPANAPIILSKLSDSKIIGSVIEQNQPDSKQVIIENV